MEVYYFAQEKDSLLMEAPKVLDFCREHEVWWLYYTAWERKAELFAWVGEFANAAEEAELIRQDAEERGNDYGRAMAYFVLAEGYYIQGFYEQAVRNFQLTVDCYPDDENPSMLISVFNNYIDMLTDHEDYEPIDSILKKWKTVIDRTSVVEGDPQAWIWANWRYLYYSQQFLLNYHLGDYDKASVSLDSADYYANFGHEMAHTDAMLYQYHCQLATAQGRYDEAIAYGDSSLAVVSDLNMNAVVIRALKYRSKAYYGKGRYREAYEDSYRLNELNDSVYMNDSREQLNVLNKRFEVAELRAQQEREHMENERTKLLLLLALGAVVLVGLCVYLITFRRSQKRLAKMKAERERIESELRIARDIQMSMVPSVFPNQPGLDMYASMTPAKEVGGDLYGYLLLPTSEGQGAGNLYFAVGDVSGKGIPASLFMAQVTRLFRTLASQQMMPSEICTHMNDALSGDDNESRMFVTMFIGLVDLQTGRLDFCNAGHNPPVIFKDSCEYLQMQSNTPIGLWPGYKYEGEHIDSIKDSVLFVYTDGLTEAENPQQEQFGDERLLEFLRNKHVDSARQLIETLAAIVEQHRNGAEPNDDLTMMCLRV